MTLIQILSVKDPYFWIILPIVHFKLLLQENLFNFGEQLFPSVEYCSAWKKKGNKSLLVQLLSNKLLIFYLNKY